MCCLILNTASDRILKDSMNLEKHQKVILSSSKTDSIGARKSVIPADRKHKSISAVTSCKSMTVSVNDMLVIHYWDMVAIKS